MKLLPDNSNLAAVLEDSRLYALDQGGSPADMHEANLYGANLIGADLIDANLRWTDLRGAKLNWQSHTLIGEVLRREAGENIARRQIAGLVAVSTDLCWPDFLRLRLKERRWALTTLAKHIQPDDDHPAILDKYKEGI